MALLIVLSIRCDDFLTIYLHTPSIFQAKRQ
jgi:hypothetical protein